MIEVLKDFPDNVAAFGWHGRVTKAEYDIVFLPDVEDRLNRHERLRIYYEFAPDFTGVTPGAAWEDAKLGFRHFRRWERIAVVSDVVWVRLHRLLDFVMPAEVRAFPVAQVAKARVWIAETQQ